MADDIEPCADCPDDFSAVTATDETEPDVELDPRGTKVTKWGPALLAPIGKPTGDKRRFAAGALSNRDLPLGLKWQRQDGQGHSGSVVIGTLDGITYDEDGAPSGFGLLFNPDAAQLPRLAEDVNEARMLLDKGVIGPSVDLDDMEFHQLDEKEAGQYAADQRPEIEVTRGRISAATLVPIPAFAEARALPLTDMDPADYAAELEAHNLALTAAVRSNWSGVPIADGGTWDAGEAAKRVRDWASGDASKEAQAYLWSDGNQHKFPIADVVDGGLKVVPAALGAAASILNGARGGTTIPEPDQARMRSIVASLRKRAGGTDSGDFADAVMGAMVAAASLNETEPAPLPAEWFADPELAGPTALTVTPDGRVFGHLATWRTCHTGIPNACTTAPKSHSKYAYFHTGAVDTTAGEMAVGRISTGGGHADTRWGFQAAAEHYDSTSAQAAVVRAGEDKHGIWVAGAALPGADLAELKRSPLSGDWRRIGGVLELVHALAVNSPGFPVPRASVVAGAQLALVAAGVLQVDEEPRTSFSPDDVHALVIETVHATRRAESNYARAMAALGAMDDAADKGTTAQRRLRALSAVQAFAGRYRHGWIPIGGMGRKGKITDKHDQTVEANLAKSEAEGPILHGFGKAFEGKTARKVAEEFHAGRHGTDPSKLPHQAQRFLKAKSHGK